MRGYAPKIAVPITNASGVDINQYSVVLSTNVTTSADGQDTRTTVDQFDGSDGNVMVTGNVVTPAFLTENGSQVSGRGTGYFDQFLYVAFAAPSTPWEESTAYDIGDTVTNGGVTYVCTTAGTTATGSGPSGTGSAVVDGSVVWSAVAEPNPGDVYGPESGKWFITPEGTGFVCQGFSLPDSNPLRALFYRSPDASSGGGGGTGGGGDTSGCGCCNCLECVDLCDQITEDVVTDCTPCGNATRIVTVNLGEDLGGTHELVYQGSCVWSKSGISITIGADTGSYTITFTAAGALGVSSTCVMTWDSGDDPLKLAEGAKVIAYKVDPDKVWSCLCNSTMIPSVAGERFPRHITASCQICIRPKAETAVGELCSSWLGCWSDLVFEGMTGNLPNEECGGPDTSASVLSFDTDQGTSGGEFCIRDNGLGDIVNSCTFSGGTYRTIVYVKIHATTGLPGSAAVLTIRVQKDTGVGTFGYHYEAIYTIGSTALGANVFTFSSASGIEDDSDPIGPSEYDWPATISLTMTDCTFGDTHPDYDYGCGSPDYGGGGTDCSGGSCIWRGQDKDGVIHGSGGAPFTWRTPSGTDEICIGGCACDDPPLDPVSAFDFYVSGCVSE